MEQTENIEKISPLFFYVIFAISTVTIGNPMRTSNATLFNETISKTIISNVIKDEDVLDYESLCQSYALTSEQLMDCWKQFFNNVTNSTHGGIMPGYLDNPDVHDHDDHAMTFGKILEEADDALALPQTKLRLAIQPDKSNMWPDAIVPYDYADKLKTRERVFMYSVMALIMERTCIKFKHVTEYHSSMFPGRGHGHFIMFQRGGKGCFARLGMTLSNGQPVNIGRNCLHRGIVLHEIGHTLGLFHTHNAFNRDDHIEIQWDKIKKDQIDAFARVPASKSFGNGFPYDYASIMHYGRSDFATIGGVTTIKTKEPCYQYRIGNINGELSFVDNALLNSLYNCSNGCPDTLDCPSPCHLSMVL